MEALLQRYLSAREAQSIRPATIAKIRYSARCFIAWLTREHPAVGSFAEATREQELAADAVAQRWERERERHACASRRVERLVAELDEPLTEEPSEIIR